MRTFFSFPSRRISRGHRPRLKLRCENLEPRLAPAVTNLFVTTQAVNNVGSLLKEFSISGTLIRSVNIPTTGGSEVARDLSVTDKQVRVYNGTFDAELSSYDGVTGGWSNLGGPQYFPGWSTVNNVSYGGLTTTFNGLLAFATDMDTAGASEKGIIRINLIDGFKERFADDFEPIDVNIGYDGYLYALDAFGHVRVYHPESLFLINAVDLPTTVLVNNVAVPQDYRALTADSYGHIYTADWGRTVTRFDANGTQQLSVTLPGTSQQGPAVGNLIDIDFLTPPNPNDGGTLVVGSNNGVISQLSSLYLSARTTFSVGSGPTFVSSGPALVEVGITAPSSSVNEGNTGTTPATFTVTLSNASPQTVNLSWNTSPSSATGGLDYQTTNGTLSFAPGETEKTITVQVIGDVDDELNETFIVRLTPAVGASTGAVITNSSAVATILDDDEPATATPAFATSAGDALDQHGDGIFDSFTPKTGTLRPYNHVATSETRSIIEFDTTGIDFDSSPVVTLDIYIELPWYQSTTAKIYGYSGNGVAALGDATQTGTLLGTLNNIAGSSIATGWRRITLNRSALAGLLAQSPYVGIVIDADTPTFFDIRGTADAKAPRINFWSATPPVLPSIDIYGGSNVEGNPGGPTKTLTYQVYLSQATTVPVTVDYATRNDQPNVFPGVDYVPVSGTLTFNPGETYKPVVVQLIGDSMYEPVEYLYLQLSNPTYASFHTVSAAGTISNDDAQPSISASPISVTEPNSGSTLANYTVSLSNPSYQQITVSYMTDNFSATAGSDYAATAGTLTFAPGETSKTVSVTVFGDTVHEPDETFKLSLYNPTNASFSGSTWIDGTIINNDPLPTVTMNSVSISESNSGTKGLAFTLNLSNQSSQAVSLTYATADGTAIVGSDYAEKTGFLMFMPGELSKTLVVTLYGDTTYEPDETFTFNLSNVNNATLGTPVATGTILNDDSLPTLSVSSPTVAEGNSGTSSLTFTVSLSNARNESITVDYTTADGTASGGSDYEGASGTLTFAPGETSKTVAVNIVGDTTYEPSETLRLNLSNATNASLGTGYGTGTITNDDSAPTLSIDSPSVAEGHSGTTELTFTISLSNPSSEPIAVEYETEDDTAIAASDYTSESGTLTFAPGETSKTVTVHVPGDLTHEADETFDLNAAMGSTTVTGTGSITNDDSVPTVNANSVAVNEGGIGQTTDLEFTVSLSNPNSTAVAVDYRIADGTASVADADFFYDAGTLTFEPGETTKTVVVQLRGDSKYEPDETFTLELSNASEATLGDNGTGTILNDDGIPTIHIATGSVTEGNSGTKPMTFIVTLSNPTVETVTVHYSTEDDTATDGSDYVATSGTLTFDPGETGKQLTVTVNGDNLFEGTEQFLLTFADPTNATLADAEAAGSIGDDDFPTVTASSTSVAEGDSGTTNLAFTLSLSNPSIESITVNYSTSNGTAIAGPDFTAGNGSVTFAPGTTSATVNVAVRGETDLESNEIFTLNLSLPNGTNATLGTTSVTGTITNEDYAPVANAGPDRNANEPATISFNGSGSSDADGDSLTYAWNFGDGTTGSGLNPSHTYLDSGTYNVTLTVNDGHGGTSTDSAVVTVANLAPTAGVTGPASGVRGQSRTFTLTAADPSPVDQAAGFSFRIDWGDGTTETASGPGSGTQVSHTYLAAGTFTVRLWAKDKDGLEGNFAGRSYQAKVVEVQGTDLFIGGTTNADQIVITATSTANSAKVSIGGSNQGTFTASGQIVVYTQAGNDSVSFATTKVKGKTYSVTQALALFGGDGADTLDARNATGAAVILGGLGNDTLYASSGRSILIGGAGADTLRGGTAEDILLGGTTDHDNNLVALVAIRTEWARTDSNYNTRRDRLLGPNGGQNGNDFIGMAQTHDDDAVDQLYGNGGQDWFFKAASDNLNDRQIDETITAL